MSVPSLLVPGVASLRKSIAFEPGPTQGELTSAVQRQDRMSFSAVGFS